ncbi:MAG: hypothetical protein K0R59_2894 [Sphingobacterium sp.]|jgi:hypothetical protein|uniref:hypothetical protein n=1 Tax=unclassified Sphingobacterium TaxID=2609468 RepID=UPI0011159E3D|nr:hypothetical protein [Sphingobacterium sp. CZ-UAM]MDF2517598.1 hypothetical protein [Sphingobacterium sp.]
MINNYLKLQYKLLTRHFKATGLPIVIAPFLLIGICYLTYYLMLQYPVFGSYTVLLSNFQLLFLLTEKNRNDFLKNTFRKRDFHKIRLLENGILVVPSFIILLLLKLWIYAGALITLAIVFAFLIFKAFGQSIPTPFTKKPFEFIIGFRRSYLLILVLYILAAIGFYVLNPNLVLFCVAGIALTCVFYYQVPEPQFYLWNNRQRPIGFLLGKFRRGLLQCFLFVFPLLLIYAVVFSSGWLNALIVLGGILFLLPFAITLKYVAYPREINFPEGFALLLCFSFYPLILALFPFYYFKALKNLNNYL